MYICLQMKQTFNIVFIGNLSDLFQQLHPEPVKLKNVHKNHHPYSTLINNINEFRKQKYKLIYDVLI